MKKNKITLQQIKKIWNNKKEQRDKKYYLEYEKISKMNEQEYILNYTEIKSKYKFSQNIKYLLNVIVTSTIAYLGYILYRLYREYFINYTKFNIEQEEIVKITIIILSGIIVILIFIFLIIIYLYFKRIKNIDRLLSMYEEIKSKKENNNE